MNTFERKASRLRLGCWGWSLPISWAYLFTFRTQTCTWATFSTPWLFW